MAENQKATDGLDEEGSNPSVATLEEETRVEEADEEEPEEPVDEEELEGPAEGEEELDEENDDELGEEIEAGSDDNRNVEEETADKVKELEKTINNLANLTAKQLALGQTLMGSKKAFRQASFDQVYKTTFKPGEVVTMEDKLFLIKHLELGTNYRAGNREFLRLERLFKAANKRYNTAAPEFDEDGRKAPSDCPNKVLLRAAKTNALKVDKATAVAINQINKGTLHFVEKGLKRANKKTKRSDAIKYGMGCLLKAQSPNAKTRRTSFNGTSAKRSGNDSP